MKKLLLAAVFALIPSLASAQAYVEGSLGFVLFPDVETDEYTIDTGFGIFEGNAEAEYNAQLGFGIEGGFQTGRWRFGASADFISAELDTARVEGVLDGVPISRISAPAWVLRPSMISAPRSPFCSRLARTFPSGSPPISAVVTALP